MLVSQLRVAVLAALPFASGAPARADRSERPTAEVLFEQGLAHMERGDYPRACTLLEQSEALDHGIGTLLYLAQCYERTGRSASAWAEFRRAASLASAAGQAERARAAGERAASLEPRLSTLTVLVHEPARGLVLERDGVPLPESTWGLAVPVDPGEHLIRARADGAVPWSGSVHVDGDGAAVTFSLPRLERAPSRPPASPPLADSRAPAPPPPPSRTQPPRRAWLWGAAAALAAGVATTLALTLRPAGAHGDPGYAGSTGDRVPGP